MSLNKKTEMIRSMLSDYSGVKLETVTKQHMENPSIFEKQGIYFQITQENNKVF